MLRNALGHIPIYFSEKNIRNHRILPKNRKFFPSRAEARLDLLFHFSTSSDITAFGTVFRNKYQQLIIYDRNGLDWRHPAVSLRNADKSPSIHPAARSSDHNLKHSSLLLFRIFAIGQPPFPHRTAAERYRFPVFPPHFHNLRIQNFSCSIEK